jgi:hypothetical protein
VEIFELLFRLEERLGLIAEGVGLVDELLGCSRLFQKFSAAIRALTSPRRFCAPGTSKKPPQMGKFVGRGGQLGCNSVEHPLHGRPPMVGEQVEPEAA